jgi:hypothetical protein
MAEVKVSGVIGGRVEEVWVVVGNFGEIAHWVPALAKSELAPGATGSQVGDKRTCTIEGGGRWPKHNSPVRTRTSPTRTTLSRVRFR